MKQAKDPKVLVISNNCFSATDSNGRTLGNFLKGWDKDSLAQFYIQNSRPDFEYCSNYFCVTDNQALSALKKGACKGGPVLRTDAEQGPGASPVGQAKRNRNALTMLARNAVWRSGRWKRCGFWSWVEDFSPDIVLLQAGDFSFMFRLAERIARKQNAKLVIYNSEGYYFKDFDYFRSKGVAKLLYPIFRADLRKALKKAYKRSEHVFYICDELKKAYDQEFKVSSTVIYTASDIEPKAKTTVHENFVASYCGNLGVGRHKGLIEIANALQEISDELFLDVYGGMPNQTVQEEFEQCRGIRYHGRVSYERVKDILYDSDLLVHVESFEDFYKEDLKFAFSTKIADSLSCGTCFLLYAPETLACSRYLTENHAAYVVTGHNSLRDTLSELTAQPASRERYTDIAVRLSQKNHKLTINAATFQDILRNVSN